MTGRVIVPVPVQTVGRLLDRRGWCSPAAQVSEDDLGRLSLMRAVQLSMTTWGDSALVVEVARRTGRLEEPDEDTARARLAEGMDLTEADLFHTFGPQWAAIVVLVRKAATADVSDAIVLHRRLGPDTYGARFEARVRAWQACQSAKRARAFDHATKAASNAGHQMYWLGSSRGSPDDVAKGARVRRGGRSPPGISPARSTRATRVATAQSRATRRVTVTCSSRRGAPCSGCPTASTSRPNGDVAPVPGQSPDR